MIRILAKQGTMTSLTSRILCASTLLIGALITTCLPSGADAQSAESLELQQEIEFFGDNLYDAQDVAIRTAARTAKAQGWRTFALDNIIAFVPGQSNQEANLIICGLLICSQMNPSQTADTSAALKPGTIIIQMNIRQASASERNAYPAKMFDDLRGEKSSITTIAPLLAKKRGSVY